MSPLVKLASGTYKIILPREQFKNVVARDDPFLSDFISIEFPGPSAIYLVPPARTIIDDTCDDDEL